jgi:hypothetical protein
MHTLDLDPEVAQSSGGSSPVQCTNPGPLATRRLTSPHASAFPRESGSRTGLAG